MDYTLSPNNVVDAGTGFRRHEDNQALPTVVSEKDMNSLIWSLMEINKAAGIAATGFDETVPATYRDVMQAVRRLAGANVTVVTAAMSPFALTADHAGLVLINAAAGNVVVNLPLANVVSGLLLAYDFQRVDAAATTVTINRAGTNSIDGMATFTLVGRWVTRSVRGDAEAAWATTAVSAIAATPVTAATTAEAQAQTENTKFITPLLLGLALKGANQALAANGFQRLPGGLILQWGTIASQGQATFTITFPIAFPTSAVYANYIFSLNNGTANANNTLIALGATNFSGINYNGVTAALFWFAIGN